MYCFAEREKILDIFEEISGARMFPSFWRIGGLAYDLNPGFEEAVQQIFKKFPRTWKDLDNLLTHNYVWCERLQDVAVIDKETVQAIHVHRPCDSWLQVYPMIFAKLILI